MTYSEVLGFLDRVGRKRGIKFGLSSVKGVLKALGLTEGTGCKTIQVAGTNGKGSTAWYLSSLLRARGFTVGRFVSPHLTDIRERITVDHRWIEEKEFVDVFRELQNSLRQFRSRGGRERDLTLFEILFLMALIHFRNCGVDMAILETGMGGRLDATTALNPHAAVITRVAMDHESFLGNSLESIAREKAAIIKTNVPLVCACPRGSVSYRIVEETARKEDAPFHPLFHAGDRLEKREGEGWVYHSRGRYPFRLQNPGRHFAVNAALALRTAEIVLGRSLEEQGVARALSEVRIPGRIEFFGSSTAKRRIVLDVAHNPDSVEALAEVLRERGMSNLVIIFGVLQDKKYKKMLDILMKLAKILMITGPLSDRSMNIDTAYKYIRRQCRAVLERDPRRALKRAVAMTEDILVIGSFSLVGPLRNILTREVQREGRAI